jgi:hypothetical protein
MKEPMAELCGPTVMGLVRVISVQPESSRTRRKTLGVFGAEA